jgi:hypothetical protein
MSEKCQFTAADEPACEISALPGKPFCSKHTVKSGSIEEMQQVNKTGLRSKQVLKNLRPEPQLDPEVAALQAAELDEPAPAPARRATEIPDDPEIYGSKLAEQLVQQEMIDRMRRFGVDGQGSRSYQENGSTKKVPFKFAPRRVRPDATVILDPDTGENPVPKGWCARWVREKDHLDRPNASRGLEFQDYGYVPVKARSGQVIKSNLGVAMMAPPQQYALRVKEKAPLGGVTRDNMLEYAEDAVKEGNRLAGVKAARVYVDDEHGSVRGVHEASA